MVAGGYDAIPRPLFSAVRADRLLLEYDDQRSGTSDPLRLVPDDKVVVLGLVTTRKPGVESEEELASRVRAADGILGLEPLAGGTQCGFATSVLGNAISIDDERRKLALIVRLAQSVFGAA